MLSEVREHKLPGYILLSTDVARFPTEPPEAPLPRYSGGTSPRALAMFVEMLCGAFTPGDQYNGEGRRGGAVVWAVDAGTVRYFGGAFVVDLLGGSSAEMAGADVQRFLDERRPSYIELLDLPMVDVLKAEARRLEEAAAKRQAQLLHIAEMKAQHGRSR